ncbi:MAG: peptide deformylase [Candidatus Cloacimonetes bacterium HGW-Cloacimonetes-3]|jgi:peptide deformylase|nr:MAG: peptide deformylase [Candidatus Cloacimonetes bacterium HGW-Cloacimonetes-3]
MNPVLLPVRLYGDEILRTKLKECDVFDPALQAFIPDLVHTMYERDGVGLAANQVGSHFRVFVIDPAWAREDASPNPIVMINPIIESREGEVDNEEGCISLPGIFAYVHRAVRISYSYSDPQGNRLHETAEGFKAVVIQHEYDHLEGIVFTDRIGILAKLKLKRKLNELVARAVNGVNIMEGFPDD